MKDLQAVGSFGCWTLSLTVSATVTGPVIDAPFFVWLEERYGPVLGPFFPFLEKQFQPIAVRI